MFWMIPAMAAASAISGAIKNKSDNKEYEKEKARRNRIRMFAAFTGQQPSGPEPEKPSAFRSIMGGALQGANAGLGIMSGVQGLQTGELEQQYLQKRLSSPYAYQNNPYNLPALTMPKMEYTGGY